MELVPEIIVTCLFPIWTCLKREDVFEESEEEPGSEFIIMQGWSQIEHWAFLDYRGYFYEKGELVIYDIKILKAPEKIEHEIRIIASVDLKWKKPAILKLDFAYYRTRCIESPDILIVLYDLEIIEWSVEFGFQCSISLLFCRERVWEFSFGIIKPESHLMSFESLSDIIQKILENKFSFIESMIDFQ